MLFSLGHDKIEASATHQSADIKKLLFRAGCVGGSCSAMSSVEMV